MVTNWETFVFLKTLFVKNTITIGVSADFPPPKKGRAILMVTNWAKLPFLKWHQLGPVSNY